MSEIICNEHVRCEVMWEGMGTTGGTYYSFLPDDGYALWRDNETGNIDPETSEPWCYWLSIDCWDDTASEYAPHIWAKLIDETMEVFGNIEPEQPVMKARAVTMSLSGEESVEDSHTYIDENGVEHQKKGVY